MDTRRPGWVRRTGSYGLMVVVATALSVLACGDSGNPSDVPADDGQPESLEGGTCVGTPAPCESFRDDASCTQQGGCGWRFHDNECFACFPTGPYACELLSDREDVCLGQVGCTWE